MKKAFCILMALLLAFLAGCTTPKEKEEIVLASGAEGSFFFEIANVMKACAFSLWDDVQITVTDSVSDAEQMKRENVQLAIIQTDCLQDASPDISWVATLCYKFVYFVAREDILSLADLAGRHIYIGAQDSETARYTAEILRSVGLAPTDWTAVYRDFLDWNHYDTDPKSVAVYMGLMPCGPLSAYAEDYTLHFAVPTDAESKAVEENSQYLTACTLSAGVYEKQDCAVNGFALPIALVADRSLSEKTVQKLTQLLYENRDLIAAGCPQMRQFDRQDMKANISVPLHEGAEEFYRSIS